MGDEGPLHNQTKWIKEEAEKNRDYLKELIIGLVRFGSYSGESQPIQLFLQHKLKELNLDTRLVRVDPDRLQKYRGFSRDGFPYDRRYSLLAVKKGSGGQKDSEHSGSGRSLMLNGHVDIVPPGDLSLWHDDPLSGKFKQGKIFGRGALDMKAGLAAAVTALKILTDRGFANCGDIIFSSVCGEETGGCGAFALVEEGLAADGCIILEPTNLQICHMQSGCHSFRLKLKGRSAHGSMAYRGINVIDKFYLIYSALKELDRRRHLRFKAEMYENPDSAAPLNIGILNAGDWPSSVPDHLEACGRMGIFPGEEIDSMHREFEEAIEEASAADAWLAANRPRVEWYEGLFEPSYTPVDSDLVKTLASCHREILARSVRFSAVSYGSDMRIFNLYAGIPTVMYGPGDVGLAHAANEHIELDLVVEAVFSIVLMLVRWCGGSFVQGRTGK